MKSLDQHFSSDILGSDSSKLGRMLRGINHSGVDVVMEREEEKHEKIFLTRPMLNMQKSNLANSRKLSNLLVDGSNNYETYIRQILDPRLAYHEKGINCPFVDNHLPFIPLLTNTIRDMTGLVDPVVDTYVGEAGMRGEQYVVADGTNYTLGSIEVDCTFDKVRGDLVERLIAGYTDYITAQNLGHLQPYRYDRVQRRRNSELRVWRLNLDATNTFLVSIACLNYGQFVTSNTGKEFDYQRIGARDVGTTLSSRIVGAGASYRDPILVMEFNKLVGGFNMEMYKLMNNMEHNMFKLPAVIRDEYNFTGYPLINYETMELEYWISKDSRTYKEIVDIYGDENE